MSIHFTYDGTSVTLHGSSRLAKRLGVLGIALGSHVFLRDALQTVSPTLVGHEIGHVRQYADLGWPRFLWRYLREWWQHGYGLEMPLEAEAQTYGQAHWGQLARVLAQHVPGREAP